MNFTPDQYAKFIESLKVTKELPKEVNGFNLSSPVERLRRNNDLNRDTFKGNKNVLHFCDLVDVLLVRIEHLESNAKPSDLSEQVKGFMRAAMKSECKMTNERHEFRHLSEATEVKP